MSFVQTAEEKIRQQAYEDSVRFLSNVDSFHETDKLTLAQARTMIDSNFSNNPQALIIYPVKSAMTMAVGNTVQLSALLYRGKIKDFNYTPDNLARDATGYALWKTNPTPTAVLSVSQGLVTGLVAGTVDVYAKVGDLTTATITITVA